MLSIKTNDDYDERFNVLLSVVSLYIWVKFIYICTFKLFSVLLVVLLHDFRTDFNKLYFKLHVFKF